LLLQGEKTFEISAGDTMKADEHNSKAPKKNDMANYLIYGVAIVVVAIAAIIFMGQGAPQAPPAGSINNTKAIDTPMAKLLLAAFDRGAALGNYYLEYYISDNGAASNYTMASDGNFSWSNVKGPFGAVEGYFSGNNSTDTICLAYAGTTKCTLVGSNNNTQRIAANLKTLLPDRRTYQSQKGQTEKLLQFGAIAFEGGLVGETVQGFSAKKITYSLDYQNLTVQQLSAIGMSPGDRSLLTLTDQKVSFWIDDKTGLVVKSLATYKNSGAAFKYETAYSGLAVGSTQVPQRPNSTISTSEFLKFYSESESDYVAKETCGAMNGTDKSQCFKGLALDKKDLGLCMRIDNAVEQENCGLILAQATGDARICSSLKLFKDDCYINVAGKMGDYEICKQLANATRTAECAKAAGDGGKKLAAEQSLNGQPTTPKNCKVDADCLAFGASKQYCAQKNTTQKFGNETSDFASCFAKTECGCDEGYCKTRKNDTYYECVDAVETDLLRGYVMQIANQTLIGNGSNRSK